MTKSGEQQPAARLRHLLEENRALADAEHADPAFLARLRQLQRWQCARLTRSHADLAAQPRYAPGVTFFIDDLYAPRDFSARDADVEHALPYMVRLLPGKVLATAADAMALQVLTRKLDAAMVTALFPDAGADADAEDIDGARYAEAYRICNAFDDRRRQIALLQTLAERLEGYVHSPMLYATLRMAHTPAKLIGLGDLQTFLERGFSAFRHMRGSEHFVRTIVDRETRYLDAIAAGSSDPFQSEAGTQ
ncbi:MAG: hypothetical protein JJT88_20095 [Gammaproteobacteria bacterium]|nr:hypothetical protein [Gammaproteobacteria bacterium]